MGTGWAGDEVRRSARIRATAAAWILLVLAAGCAGGNDASPTLRVERDTVGDTLVVRTVAGSVWGADASLVPRSPSGSWKATSSTSWARCSPSPSGPMGQSTSSTPRRTSCARTGRRRFPEQPGPPRREARASQGPGRRRHPLRRPLSCATPATAASRPTHPTARRRALGRWCAAASSPPAPCGVDRNDNVYIQVLLDPTADLKDWRMGLARIGPDGVAGTTPSPHPGAGFEPPTSRRAPRAGSPSLACPSRRRE